MSQKSQTRLLVAISAVILAALGALVGARSSASLEGKRRSEALETLPNLDIEVALACVGLIAVGFILYFCFGRDRKSDTRDASFDTSRDGIFAMQPAVLGRLTRENKPDADDITATVLHLAQQGVLRITPTTRVNASGREVLDYLLEREGAADGQPGDFTVESTPGDLTSEDAPANFARGNAPVDSACGNAPANPVERATLNLLFDIAGGGADAVLLGDVHSYGRNHFQAFTQAIASWQKTLTEEVACRHLFDGTSKKLQLAMAFCAGAFILCGALMLLATRSALPLVCLAITAAIYALLAKRMPRTTQRGADALASTETLRAWLAKVAESQPEAHGKASEEWAALMPYAFVLGAASDTIDALAASEPSVLADGDLGYAPWVLWYSESLAAIPVAREISNCICGTAFAAAATEATAQLRSLNSPVQGALSGGGLPEVGGISTSPSPASNRMR